MIRNENQSNSYGNVPPAQFSSLEEMNNEAQKILDLKKEELTNYQNVVLDAENILRKLTTEVEDRTKLLQQIREDDQTEIDNLEDQKAERELSMNQKMHEDEIAKLKSQHQEEMTKLQADFQQTLTEAENWANKHSEIALQEKMDELELLKQEAVATKRQLDEVTFMTTRTKEAKESENEQKKNTEEITALENQISELTSITREEMRDSRAKIDETLAAIEIRRVSHQAELKRLDEELFQRKESYDQHLESIKLQYENERNAAEQSIQSAIKKAENTESIYKQLEEHHKAQLAQVLSDIDSMRKYTGSTSNPKQSVEEMKQSLRDNQSIRDEIKSLEDELKMVNEECRRLEDENRDLKLDLQRYNRTVQQMNMK
jgi:hypothetical protein